MGDNNQNASSKHEEQKYQVYLEERKSLIEQKIEGATSFDKSILTLSSGALGLSLLFIEKIAPEIKPGTTCLLVLAWVFFGLSILSTLISFLTSQSACDKQVEILEALFCEDAGDKSKCGQNKYAYVTQLLNYGSIAIFIIGVIFLIVFSSINVSK